ncbi:MAG: lasso peptide biosynthesis B2 protein [Actinomycetia bacterium]|nr:lasso peptide biosynthesis B2 protein [Actinomycetes bacterium]
MVGAARLAISRLRFERLEDLLGERLAESPREITPWQLRQARMIAWAVRTVSPYTPWKSNCFPQALTTKLLLRRRGVESTLYIGAAFTEDKSALQAHAWLRCGSYFVAGGDGAESFGAVASNA